MSREQLPSRRRNLSFALNWPPNSYRGHEIIVDVGFYSDGRAGELFLHAGKSGEQLEAATRDGAIILSLLLQRGGDLDAIARALTRDESGAPASMLGFVVDAAAQIVAERGQQ